MIKKRIWVWMPIICLSLSVLSSQSGAMGLEAAIGVSYQDFQGGLANSGDSLDLNNELRFSRAVQFLGRIKIDMPLTIPNLYLMATPMHFDGTATGNRSFKFGSQTFDAGIPFSSTLKLDHYDLALYYGVPFVKEATLGIINFEAGLNIRLFDLKTQVTQMARSESNSFNLLVPMAYLGLQVKPMKTFSLEGEFRWIAYNSNHYYDLIGRVKYNFSSLAFVSIGYRQEEISMDQSDIKMNVRFSGPQVEVGFQF
jgi:outer membrane protein